MITIYAVGNIDNGVAEEDFVASKELASFAVVAKINEDSYERIEEASAHWRTHPGARRSWEGEKRFVQGDDYWYYREVKVLESETEIAEEFQL